MQLTDTLASTHSKTWRVLLLHLLLGWVAAKHRDQWNLLVDDDGDVENGFGEKNRAHLGDDAVLLTGGITGLRYKSYGKDKTNMADRNERQMHAFESGLKQIIDTPVSTPVDIMGASFQHMVKKANPGIEVIVHNWNPELASRLLKAYSPEKMQFEANSVYEKQFNEVLARNNQSLYGQISRAYSFMQASRLMVEREVERGKKFRRVVFVRSDVLYFTPLRIRDMMITPTLVYIGRECGLNNDALFAMTRNAAVKFSTMYNFIGKELPARVAFPGQRQCSNNNRHWMRIFIEDYMNMTLINHDDGRSAAIYRFVEYNVIVEYADYLKSLGYTFKHALAVASRGSVEQREGQTKEEADANDVVDLLSPKASHLAVSGIPSLDLKKRKALTRMKRLWGEDVAREVVQVTQGSREKKSGNWFCKKPGVKCKTADRSICLKVPLLCTDKNVGEQLLI